MGFFTSWDVLLVTQQTVLKHRRKLKALTLTRKTRHRASTSTRGHFSRSALCCHSNETCAPIANPANSAKLESNPYHSQKLHLGPCSSVGTRRGTDRQTHRQPRPICILPRLRLTRNVITHWPHNLFIHHGTTEGRNTAS